MTDALTVGEMVPCEFPPWWEVQPTELPGGLRGLRCFYARPRMGYVLLVFVTIDDYDDGAGVWFHSSISRQTKQGARLPSWEDLKTVHEVIHSDRPVVQLLPPRSSWLSITECLHLFERLDAPTVPENLWRSDK